MSGEQEPAPPHAAPRTPHPDTTARFVLIALIVAGLALIAVLLAPEAVPAPPVALAWSAIAPPPETPMRAWRWIVIHHSGGPSGDTALIDRWHERGRGWDGIGYHFVIGNGAGMPSGRIEATWRWRCQDHGAHAGAEPTQKPYNQAGIGICLIGDYRDGAPDVRLQRRLVELCTVLIEQVPGLRPDAIIGHDEVPGKATDCPGHIDVRALRAAVAAELAARMPR